MELMPLRDPLFLDTLAAKREVVIFDNTGDGKSTGEAPVTYTEWAEGIKHFVLALRLKKLNILGFSMGGLAGSYNYLPLSFTGLIQQASHTCCSQCTTPRLQAHNRWISLDLGHRSPLPRSWLVLYGLKSNCLQHR